MLLTYRRLWQLLAQRERRQAIILLIMILIMGVLQMAGVAAVMPFMSVAATPEIVMSNRQLAAVYAALGFTDPNSFLFFLGILVFLVITLSIAFKALTTYARARFTTMRAYTVSRKLMAGYLRQPYEWFLNRHSADLARTILSESEQVVRVALDPAMGLLADTAVVLAIVVLLILVDPGLAFWLTFGIGGAYVLAYLALRRRLHALGAERLLADHERFHAIQEAFGSVKDVKFSGLEGPLLRRYDGPAQRFAHADAMHCVASQIPRFMMEVLAFGGLLLVILYLLRTSGNLQLALPTLTVYAFGAYRLMPAAQGLYGQLVALRYASPALEHLHRELTLLPPVEEFVLPMQRARPLGLTHQIRLDHVTYSYPGSTHPAICRLSLTIPARGTLGLVGKTGAGKTTLVDLILGLLRPAAGVLTVDGVPITADNMRAWQATIGYVPQQIYLADASISANIAFGITPEKIDANAVERAARTANLHEFVTRELPNGYATAVGERGVRLSGGQRQRVGIARALYHDPELLILDEATSALDNLTEQAVMEAIDTLSRRKTIILIAHRLTTVRTCDRVVLLDGGRIEAEDSYDGLTQRSPTFVAMIEASSRAVSS